MDARANEPASAAGTHRQDRRTAGAAWLARIAVAVVFAVNVQCAAGFIANPGAFAGAYELSGDVGNYALQGLGIAFLMWNVTYPLVILSPLKHRTLFGVVLAQQVVGLAGERYVLGQLTPAHAALADSIGRFISFDAFGLVIMGATFALLLWCAHHAAHHATAPRN
ncbi:MAG: hypothetical protein ACOX12_02905 [Eggerthellaceae bacterium]|jgi:hypothetical protein